jgi:hypothetical protein
MQDIIVTSSHQKSVGYCGLAGARYKQLSATFKKSA